MYFKKMNGKTFVNVNKLHIPLFTYLHFVLGTYDVTLHYCLIIVFIDLFYYIQLYKLYFDLLCNFIIG